MTLHLPSAVLSHSDMHTNYECKKYRKNISLKQDCETILKIHGVEQHTISATFPVSKCSASIHE